MAVLITDAEKLFDVLGLAMAILCESIEIPLTITPLELLGIYRVSRQHPENLSISLPQQRDPRCHCGGSRGADELSRNGP
ncbi:unnamed protein product [Heligmosomoides polygyrus]|uniref:HA2 domain-containing protein n=1 Tax=Heligmosomoides polygyrus TaxID=6339 RepID=A0A183G628_HELPZ|nr:unnamed protein product [Heligmosomoides polygyrus]